MFNIHSPQPIIFSLFGYGAVLYLFFYALLAPEQNINFMYNVGIFIFVSEFLSIHSSGMLTSPDKVSRKLPLFCLYLAFVAAFSLMTQTFYPAVIFVLSLVAKLFDKTPNGKALATSLYMFLGTVFLTIFLSPLISAVFDFPQSVLDQAPANTSGLFVEQPQTLLVWGILYYAGLMILQVRAFRKTLKKSV